MTSNIKQYLQAIQQMGASNFEQTGEGFLLRHGQLFRTPKVSRPDGLKKQKDHLCYQNSYNLVVSKKGYQYVEGLAVTHGIPLHHAWVITPDQTVIDMTWETPGTEYFGVIFPIQVVNAVALQTRVYGILESFYNKEVRDIISKHFE